MNSINKIKNLTNKLNRARKLYYNTDNTIMSDAEYDRLLTELEKLENLTGYKLSNSPTEAVGAPVLSKLKKIKHVKPMLSLKKCHSAQEVLQFSQDKDIIASIKCDGLSCRLTYEDGFLVKAETRGDGIEGVDVTNHAKHFKNIPLTIPFKEKYIIDGEAIIPNCYLDEINSKLPKGAEPYKNTRNLASGTLNSLDTSVVKDRYMYFIAWDVIEPKPQQLHRAYDTAEEFGFTIVNNRLYNFKGSKEGAIRLIDLSITAILKEAQKLSIPCDGVVFKFDDIAYGESLGKTEHHFNNGIAYKPAVSAYKTTLRDIEWNTTRSGIINPKAVFDPVDIDGSTITKATLHNIGYIQSLELGIGDTIEVIKSNEVIPRVENNITRSNTYKIPDKCPCCGSEAQIDDVVLRCINPDCAAKQLSKFSNFVSRNCMNISGFSDKTIEKLINRHLLKDYYSIYELYEHRNILEKMEGFGKSSVDNLLKAIEESKDVDLAHFIAALGIPNIGLGQAKALARYYKNWEEFKKSALCENHDFSEVEGIGSVVSRSITDWFKAYWNIWRVANLATLMRFTENNIIEGNIFNRKTFVVTGSVYKFKNRKEIENKISENGGKTASAVSKNTDYLICNEKSSSSKYKKAEEFDIPIITEDDFIDMLREGESDKT